MRKRDWRKRLAPIVVGVIAIVAVWLLPDLRPPSAGFDIGPMAAARGTVLEIDEPSFDQSDSLAEPGATCSSG